MSRRCIILELSMELIKSSKLTPSGRRMLLVALLMSRTTVRERFLPESCRRTHSMKKCGSESLILNENTAQRTCVLVVLMLFSVGVAEPVNLARLIHSSSRMRCAFQGNIGRTLEESSAELPESRGVMADGRKAAVASGISCVFFRQL
jgi:hypothetical protein